MKKVLLIANYKPDRQQSMLRYGDWLARALAANGYQVLIERPHVWLGRFAGKSRAARKWLGYIDKLVIFPLRLLRVSGRCDLVHIPDHANAYYCHFVRGKPVVVTCHDLIGARSAKGEFPGQHVRASGRVLQTIMIASLRRIPDICCVSQATQADVVRLVGATGHRIAHVPNPVIGYSPMPASRASALLAAAGLDSTMRFFLHVGTNAWYKNRDGVLALYARLVRKSRFRDFHLVLAGEEVTAPMKAWIAKEGFGERIHGVANASTETLCALYNTAEALLFPSLAEGFGWPIVEAQACGCPVVTSDREPMKSVGGEAALLIDPEKPEQAAEKIDQAWDEFRLRRASSLDNAGKYSERAAFEAYRAVYASIFSECRAGSQADK